MNRWGNFRSHGIIEKGKVQHTLSSSKRRDRERANSVNMEKVGGEKIVKMKTKEADDELIDNLKKDFFFGGGMIRSRESFDGADDDHDSRPRTAGHVK